MSTQSEFINLNTAGYVGSLRIEITGDEVSFPIKLKTVTVNAHHPFAFSWPRFSLAFGVLLLAFMFRPRSSVYRINMVANPVKSKAGIIAAVAVEIALVSTFLFYGSNLVGVATSTYNYGSWDGKSVVNAFEVGGENAQQYAELARAMAHGQLYLDEEPPDWLKSMDDPYDKSARDELQKETGEPYLFDVAYYDGHYYVYFGVVPVLLFYLPFYLATGANFPTAIGVLVMAIAFILGCSALLDRFARYHFKRVSLGVYLLLQIPLVMCCGMLYLVKFPTFYSLPIMCGLAFSVWGLYCWMRGRLSKHACAWFMLGSFCMALVADAGRSSSCSRSWRFRCSGEPTSPSVAPSRVRACASLRVCSRRTWWSRRESWRTTTRASALFTDFGANYNLTVNDMTKRGMNVGRLAPAFFAYFLQPPNVTGVFPFIEPAQFDTTYMGQTIKEVTFGGIFACLPVLWALPFTGRVLALRRSQRSTRTIFGVIVVLLVAGVAVALLDAELAGILQRYYADFSFMFLAASVLLLFIVNENLREGSSARDVFVKVLVVLVGLSLLYSALVCFVPKRAGIRIFIRGHIRMLSRHCSSGLRKEVI